MAHSWHTEKNFLSSGWHRSATAPQKDAVLKNLRRMPPPKPLPNLTSMTFQNIPAQPYSAEASKVRDFLGDEALDQSARMMPVPALIRDPAMGVVEHYEKARARTLAREAQQKIAQKLERDLADKKRTREANAKRRLQERKEAIENGATEEELDRLEAEQQGLVDDDEEDPEVAMLAALDDGRDKEPLSDDEIVDELFEQSFRDEHSLVRALDRTPELRRLNLPEHTWLSPQFLRQLPPRYGSTL